MVRFRIDSLQLHGFKSFADKAELTFPGDVCAIVGPNGCGKSNIVDAMLWVLGEQSPSLLRLKHMGDLVFSGTSGRPAAGVAEIELRLRCDDGRWEESDGCLQVTRKVFRTGPSQYRLNGRNARLKDVTDQLLGVGLGTRNYAIIEQGRVGQVLSARPTDRRILLEEAAGITRYKLRKREAELKLEQTRQNLLRLEDVVGEVERSLRQLKRQARQAVRFKKLEDGLKESLGRLFTIEAHTVAERRADITRRRAQVENDVAAAAAALGGAEADLTDARKGHEAARGEVEEARSEVATLLTSRERLETFLERSADLLDNLRTSLARTRNESVVMSSRRSELQTQIAEAQTRLEGMEAALDDVKVRVAETAEAAAGAREQVDQAEQAASRLRKDLLRLISALTTSRNDLRNLEREQDRLTYTLSQLDQEHERLEVRRSETAERYGEASKNSSTATAAAKQLEGRSHQLNKDRSHLSEQAATVKREADALGHNAWEYRHRLAGVERDLARSTAAVEQLTAVLPSAVVVGQVGDFLSPAAEVAPLLDRVWRELLDLPVIRAANLTPEERANVAQLEARIRIAVATDAPALEPMVTPPGAESLLDLAGIESSQLGWLARVLPPAFRCSEAALAASLAELHPRALFLDPDGMLWRGRIMEPPTAGTRLRGALAMRSEKEDLQRRVTETVEQADAAGQRHEQLGSEIAELDDSLSTLSRELVEAEQERARTTAVEQSLGQELSRLQRELDALLAEIERNTKLKENQRIRRGELERTVAVMDKRSQELEQAVETANAALETCREESGEALRRRDRWQGEERLASERTNAARGEAKRIDNERRNLDARLTNLAGEEKKLAAELATTEDEVVHSRTRLAEEQGLLAAARERERRLAEGVERGAGQVAGLETEVRNRRAQHETVRDTLHEVTVEQTRADSEWERLRDSAVSELGTTPEQLLSAEVVAGDTAEALRLAIDEARARLEKIGPVNLLAIKEVEELEERSGFLRGQRKDLIDSLRTLEETIAEIDGICSERFVATFEQVTGVFAETFTHLFGGGTARLELVDEDNPLESGIDITAQPPGKKIQSVQLLSGGEKALTALSLLIALFRIKPSPFCILDEVDAPLDDANVERLSELVHSMTEHTQFIMITHNRRTMSRADVLYGVTMGEPGVSKVVSVRLEE